MDGDVTSQLERLHEASDVLVALYDAFDRIRYANRAFRDAYFVDRDEAPTWAELMRRNHGLRRGTVLRVDDVEAWLTSTLSRRGKTGFRAFETDLHDGRWLWMTETVQSEGWMLCIASDITGLRVEERAIRQDRDQAIKASYTDDLTGIANRRFLTTRIEQILSAHRADAQAGCLVVIDLDHFKLVNDRFGHQTGDIILRDFALQIQGQLRRADSFGRMGGEEFALTLPDTSLEHARLILERMLAVVRASRPLTLYPDFTYSFSAGISVCRPEDTLSEFYRRADEALYQAKVAGRNQALVFVDPVDTTVEAR
ncbi:GGDEF domain-containing protein [Kaistia sp. 32K]|uniref:sensor domain-containing diguanylate cyclase n=1 Tax=Kaistia sp. 32K TaxID=2795690 RepID=UPI001916852A|nr:GGDEF domain-containing protein [Kaistia sp. 32K]BCP51941.1 GGDEF domain-containing protein [Kaistia sp. 32K]